MDTTTLPTRLLRVGGCALLALALACGTDFVSASQVSSLRILGVRAEPAEPRPGQPVTLQTLVVDPTRPGAASAILWLGCAPTANSTSSACSNTDALLSLTSASDGGLPEGVSLLGLGPQVVTQTPTNVFGPDAGALDRQTGVLASAVLIAVAAPPPTTEEEANALFDRVRNKEVPNQLALFRYPVSESDAPNHNPVLDAYVVNGETLPKGGTVRLQAPDASVDLAVPDTDFEPYVQHAPAGDLARTETLAARYYASQLLVDTEAVQVRGTTVEKLSPGGIGSDGANRAGHLWTVVRDTRGGQSWIDAKTYVCDPSAPAPSAVSASRDGGTVTVAGANLASVLDLQLGDAVLGDLQCDAATSSGALPALDAGTYPLTLRAKSCADVQTGVVVSVP
jgi:hypothetical protein